MTPGPDYSEEDIALAGEYALDLLPAAERQAFEARLADEPQLRLLVLQWDEGFVPLTDAVPPVDPPAMVRARIEARLFPEERRGWFRPWMGALGGALAAALVVVAVFLITPEGPSFPTHRADVAASDGSLRISAEMNADTGTITVTRLAGGPAPNRALDLWLIADGDPLPRRLGMLSDAETTELTLAVDLRDRLTGAVLAISDEPPGGSPTGSPTGTILAVGGVTPQT